MNKFKAKLLVILIILIAVFLRLGNLWYIEFKGDEAANSFLALDFVDKGIFPLAGDMSSIGTYNPPIFVYLISLPFLFSKNPVFISGFTALLNILAVYLCFLFCKAFFNRRTALIATTFFAVNPWAILYSRKIWSPDHLSLFVLIFFYSLYKVIIKQKQKYIIVLFLCLSILTQLHPPTLYYLFVLCIVLMIFRPNIKPANYVIGVGSFFLLYLPYILFDVKNNFYNLNVFLKSSKLPFIFRPHVFWTPFKLAVAGDFHCPFDFSVLNVMGVLVLISAIIYLLCRSTNKSYFILLLWFFIPPLVFLFNKMPHFSDRYLIALFPVQFIMIGIGADALMKKLENRHTSLSLLAVTVIVLLISGQFICSFLFFNDYITKHNNIFWEGYGPPFTYRVEEIGVLMRKGYKDPQEIHRKIVHSKPEPWHYKYDFPATKYIVENISSITGKIDGEKGGFPEEMDT